MALYSFAGKMRRISGSVIRMMAILRILLTGSYEVFRTPFPAASHSRISRASPVASVGFGISE